MVPNTKLPKTPVIKIYTGLISQSGTTAPVVKVLHNTIGEIVWTRTFNGTYTGTLNNAFTPDKTVAFVGNGKYGEDGTVTSNTNFTLGSEDTVVITTEFDGEMVDMPIEIRVYN